LIMIFKSIK